MPHKRVSKQESRRRDHKRERQAVRQAIEGGHVRQPQHDNWSSPNEPTPIVHDEQIRSGHVRKTGCPKNHGKPHVKIRNPKRHLHHSAAGFSWWVGPEFVCYHCNKNFWGSPKNWIVK